MEIRHRALDIGLPGDEQPPGRLQDHQGEHHPDDTGQEIADRQALRGRVLASRTFEARVEGRAEIGTEHEREGRVGRHDAPRRKGHHEQHDRDRRVGRPGEGGGQHDVDKRLGRDDPQQEAQARLILIWGHEGQELAQRHEHQAEPDQHAAEIARGCRGAAKQQHAEEDQRSRGRRSVEGEELNDQRGADIGAEHHGQGRHEVDEAAGREAGDHQARGGAAL